MKTKEINNRHYKYIFKLTGYLRWCFSRFNRFQNLLRTSCWLGLIHKGEDNRIVYLMPMFV
jgi:hypothetical protein